MLNIYIAVVIEVFASCKTIDDQLTVKKKDIKLFLNLWKEFDPQAKGFINCYHVDDKGNTHFSDLDKLLYKIYDADSAWPNINGKVIDNLEAFVKNDIVKEAMVA